MYRKCNTLAEAKEWIRTDINRTSSRIELMGKQFRFANNEQIKGANLVLDMLESEESILEYKDD